MPMFELHLASTSESWALAESAMVIRWGFTHTWDEWIVDFCRRFTDQEYQGLPLHQFETRITVSDVLTVSENRELLFLIGTMILICRPSLQVLAQEIRSGDYDLLGPIVGGGHCKQSTQYPLNYLDIDTFREVSHQLNVSGEGLFQINSLLPDIFVCSRRLLMQFPPDTPMDQLDCHPQWLQLRKAVCPKALAHDFRNYYRHDRSDLATLIPSNVQTLLDIGCGEGALGQLLRQTRPWLELTGVEVHPPAAAVAARHYKYVHSDGIATFQTTGRFDCIVCGDVLEHLVDPWQTISQLADLLAANGVLVGSCPNIAHWSVVRNLLLGKFEYLPSGILCRDHLRFFTEQSLKELIQEGGLQLATFIRQKFDPTPEGRMFVQSLPAALVPSEDALYCIGFTFVARKESLQSA